MQLFNRYGYEEVVTPTLEYLETLTTGSGRSLEPHMFKMFDRNNQTLALHHEMTTPIARLVSSRLKDEPLPLKLSYNTSVFRYEQTLPGRQCEFYQAGVELLGASSTAADAEIVALAVEALRSAGLDEFEICLGQVEFANGLLDQCKLDLETQSEYKSALATHNIVRLERLVDGLNLDGESAATLKALPYLHGDRACPSEANLLGRLPHHRPSGRSSEHHAAHARKRHDPAACALCDPADHRAEKGDAQEHPLPRRGRALRVPRGLFHVAVGSADGPLAEDRLAGGRHRHPGLRRSAHQRLRHDAARAG